MATTRELLRTLVTQEVGGSSLTAMTTSSAGNGGGTTLVDTDLARFGNAYFENWWVVITSGTNDGEIRRVSDFVSSTGTITVPNAFTGQVATSVTYELHKYDPTVIHNALSEAMKVCYGLGHLYISRRDESIVIDNLLLNADFETFSGGAFTSWTLAGASAADNQSTTIVWHGASAAQIVADSGADATLSQAVNTTPGLAQINQPAGKAFTFGAWLYATEPNTARLQITDGTNTTSHAYHSGNDGWEYQEVTLTPISTFSTVTVRLQVVAGGTAYIDASHCHVERLTRYALPSTINDVGDVGYISDQDKQNPRYIRIEGWEIQEGDNTRYLVLHRDDLPAGTRLQLQGRIWLTPFTSASTDATTVEIDAPRTRVLVLKAAELLMRWEAQNAPVGQREGYRERVLELAADYEREAVGNRMIPTVRSPMRRW